MRKLLFLFSFICLFLPLELRATPSDGKLLSTLYDSGHPATGEFGEIREITSWKGFLYVSWTDLTDGDFWFDVWNLSDPRSPQFVTNYFFGNNFEDSDELVPDAHLKLPRDLAVINGKLTLWSDSKLYVYQIEGDGTLTELGQHTFYPLEMNRGSHRKGDLIDFGLGRLSYGGSYASSPRGLISNPEYLDLLQTTPASALDWLFTADTLINLENPARPFLMRTDRGRGGEYLAYDEPLSGTYQGMPASVWFEGFENNQNLSIRLFREEAPEHLDSFWMSKLRKIFRKRNFNKSLRRVLDRIPSQRVLKRTHQRLIGDFSQEIEAPLSTTLAQLISGNYQDSVLLSGVLEEYRIGVNERFTSALEKVIEAEIGSDLDQRLARVAFNAALLAWRRSFFEIDNPSLASLKGQIKRAMDIDLRNEGTVPYLVLKLLRPLVGNPPFLRLTLNELFREIDGTWFAQRINDLLGVFHDLSELFVAFDPPDCFQIPETVLRWLRLIFIEHGPRLKPRGLAVFELLKLAQYYTGDTDFSGFTAEIRQKILQLHDDLSTDMVRSLLAGIKIPQLDGTRLDRFIQAYGEGLSVRKPIASSIAQVVLRTLNRAGLDTEGSVSDVLSRRGLYLSYADLPLGGEFSTVADLQALLRDLGVQNLRLRRIFELSLNGSRSPLKATLQIPLVKLTAEIFGASSLDLSFEAAVRALILSHLDPQILGDFIGDVIGRILWHMTPDDPPRPQIFEILDLAERAANGDCIAQWQIVLHAAAIASALTPMAGVFEGAEVALESAYEAAVDYLLEALMSQFFSGIISEAVESYSTWASSLTSETFTVDLHQLSGFPARIANPFIWKDRVAVVLHDVGYVGGESGRVALLIFKPTDPAGTAQLIELGQWDTLNRVVQDEDSIMIEGRKPVQEGGFAELTELLIDFVKRPTESVAFIEEDAYDLAGIEGMTTLNNGQNLAVFSVQNRVTVIER